MEVSVEALIPILVIAAIAIVILALQSGKGKLGVDIYQRKGDLFSAAELRFLAALDQAIAPGHRVFGKVRVADLVAIRSGLNPKTRQIALNRLSQKHFDFVICSGRALAPVCAIELNDSSHSSNSAKRRDDLIAAVCGQVGLPLLVVKAAGSYSPDALRQQIAGALQSKSGQDSRSVA
jgi:hypothetical protein